MAKKVVKKVVAKVKKPQAKKAKLVSSSWVTYQISNATYKLGTNPDAHYGLFLYQVKKEPGEKGKWLHRCLEKNGDHEWEGPITLLTNAQGEARFSKAEALVGLPTDKKATRKKVKNG